MHLDNETEPTTEELVERFNRHCDAVERNGIATATFVYHVLCAKGLHKLLAERAYTLDDDKAGDVALGAQHWVTYNDGTLSQLLASAER